MSTWAKRVNSIVLFFEDLPAATEFYRRVFEVPVQQILDDCFACTLGGQYIVLVGIGSSRELVAPVKVASGDAGVRGELVIFVDDVDRTAARLVERGVTLIRAPEDRPEGYRRALFADPGGHVYEVSSEPQEPPAV